MRWLLVILVSASLADAGIIIQEWEPVFKGIDHTSGYSTVDTNTPRQQQVQAFRVDLQDPDVELFTTPRATNSIRETIGQTTSEFLQTYGLQVAINASLYSPCCSATSGTPMNAIGLAISRGVVVSAQEGPEGSSVIMFTSNKVGSIVSNNWPPQGTNGIYTAIAGRYVVLENGVNIGIYTPEAALPNPRTAVGLSQNGRYLIMMTIDGRQPGWSDGAVDSETADWLIRFGACNGLNLDGGGSTTIVQASDCDSSALLLNQPNDGGVPDAERVVANNFGVFAKRLPNLATNIMLSAARDTATVTSQTSVPAIGRIDFGTTARYGLSSMVEPTERKHHAVTLNDLSPATSYFFRINSTAGNVLYTYRCVLRTTPSDAIRTELFGITQGWKFTTNNLDSTKWQTPEYNDSSWAGPAPGNLYCENNDGVPFKNTPVPSRNNTNGVPGTGTISPTYYFRTHFSFSGGRERASLIFSNYVDDGAVFYLNGTEIYRLRMEQPPAMITFSSLTTNNAVPCSGDAYCADIFSISGAL